jgi:hypothetical protein
MDRKRRPKGPDPVEVVPIDERERMVSWFRNQLRDIQTSADERIERLRTVGEHPSPIFGQLVQHHAAMGLAPSIIAKMLMIPYSTLMLHYEEDIDLGAAHINLKIAENMARIATSTTDKDAAKVGMDWLAKRGGETWRTTKKIEIDDKREKTPIIDSSKLSAEDRQKLREVIEAALQKSSENPKNDDDDDDSPALIEGPNG